MIFLTLVAGWLAVADVPLMADAEVVTATASGFTVRIAGDVAAPPDRVYDALTNRIADWWSPNFTWSGDARAVSLEARAGGCFCEKLSGGGSAEIMRVVFAEPGKMLRLSGAPGRLQETATVATFSWGLSSTPAGTRVDLTIAAGGYLANGYQPVAETIDQAFIVQLARLKRFVETGKP